MAKKLLTSYTFTPGAANVGTVVVPGTYALEQFLLITNVTDGVTIFQFNSPSRGGAVSTGGGNTTLTLEADTSSMNAGNRLQVFVDDGQNPQFTLTNASVEISNDAGNAVPVSGTVTANTGLSQPLTDAQLRASAVSIATASLPLPSGAATAANQSTTNASLASIDGKAPALVSGRVPVDGSGVTQPVSGSVTVSGTVTALGPLTDAQLRASAVPVSTASLPLPTGAATQTTLASVDGKLPALDTGYVPVLVKNGQLEITNDTGNPLPVGPAAQLNVTGSASANNTDLISVACDAYRSVNFQITGTWSGTITYQVSNDNANWVAFNVIASNAITSGSSTTSNLVAYGALTGYQFFRIRFTAYTSGTASVTAYFSREIIGTGALPGNSVTISNITGSATSSATTLYTVNSAATTNAANIKASGANLYGLSVMNTSATTKYVRLFNLTTAPTMGTSVPIMVVAVPATSSKEIQYVPALRFNTGLAVAITGGAAATDNTAVAAGDVQLLVSYA